MLVGEPPRSSSATGLSTVQRTRARSRCERRSDGASTCPSVSSVAARGRDETFRGFDSRRLHLRPSTASLEGSFDGRYKGGRREAA